MKNELASSCLSVRLSARIGAAATGRICVKFRIETVLLKSCRENPNLVKITQKYRELYLKTSLCLLLLRKKVKHSHYRPEVPGGFQEVKVPRLRDNGTGWC